jgi:hypothetical protein
MFSRLNSVDKIGDFRDKSMRQDRVSCKMPSKYRDDLVSYLALSEEPLSLNDLRDEASIASYKKRAIGNNKITRDELVSVLDQEIDRYRLENEIKPMLDPERASWVDFDNLYNPDISYRENKKRAIHDLKGLMDKDKFSLDEYGEVSKRKFEQLKKDIEEGFSTGAYTYDQYKSEMEKLESKRIIR